MEEWSDDDNHDHIKCMIYTTNGIMKQGLLLVNYICQRIKRAKMKHNVEKFKGHVGPKPSVIQHMGGSTYYRVGWSPSFTWRLTHESLSDGTASSKALPNRAGKRTNLWYRLHERKRLGLVLCWNVSSVVSLKCRLPWLVYILMYYVKWCEVPSSS